MLQEPVDVVDADEIQLGSTPSSRLSLRNPVAKLHALILSHLKSQVVQAGSRQRDEAAAAADHVAMRMRRSEYSP